VTLTCAPNVQKALEINQLTPAMLEGAPKFEDVANNVWSEISKATVLVAHNIDFDLRMLRQEFDRVRLTLPSSQVYACTQCIDFRTDPHGRGWKLADLSSRYQVPQQTPAHRALADAKTAGMLFTKQLHHLPEEMTEMGKFAEQAITHWKSKGKRR